MKMTLDFVLEVICPRKRSENCVGAALVLIYTTEVPLFVVVYLFSTINYQVSLRFTSHYDLLSVA